MKLPIQNIVEKRGFKFKFHPTEEQIRYLKMHIGAARKIYNALLSEINEEIEKAQKEAEEQRKRLIALGEMELAEKVAVNYPDVSAFALRKRITALKKREEFRWISELCFSEVVGYEGDSLADAFQSFFRNCKNGIRDRLKEKAIEKYKRNGRPINWNKINRICYPNFKRFEDKRSFRLRNFKVNLYGLQHKAGYFVLPKAKNSIGQENEKVEFVAHRNFSRELKFEQKSQATIKCTGANRWYISFLANVERKPCKRQPQNLNHAMGIDCNVKHNICALYGVDAISLLAYNTDNRCFFMKKGDGVFVPNPKFGKKIEQRSKRLQRNISRKLRYHSERVEKWKEAGAQGDYPRKSNNFIKEKEKLAVLFERLTNRRNDYLDVVTNAIANIKDLNVVVMEDLAIKNMTASAKAKPVIKEGAEKGLPPTQWEKNNKKQKQGLNKAILDASLYKFKEKLSYKLQALDKSLVEVDPKYTSQSCSECGHTDSENRQTQETFLCVACGHEENADINAAKNILRRHFA